MFNYPPYKRFYNPSFYNYYRPTYFNTSSKNNNIEKNSITNLEKTSNTINSNLTEIDQPVINILNIKLYFDDLIILGLLFFLYQQDVKDEMLYIILFLLLFN